VRPLAHALLERSPRLRAWRQQRLYRRQPRRMAAWFRDLSEGPASMHTRLCLSNLELPEAAHLCQPTTILVSLFGPDGATLAQRRFRLGRNQSLVQELGELLPASARGRLPSGLVYADFEGPQLGSSRAYLHWYNDHSLTSSHEKFGLTIPAVAGYWTVPNVQHTPDYHTHLAVVNLDERPYTSSVVLAAADGDQRQASLTLPPRGSRFLPLPELLPEAPDFLARADGPGILYFGNNQQPAMYYYFILNPRLGTWRAQHL
jgi:hypothetical protein